MFIDRIDLREASVEIQDMINKKNVHNNCFAGCTVERWQGKIWHYTEYKQTLQVCVEKKLDSYEMLCLIHRL